MSDIPDNPALDPDWDPMPEPAAQHEWDDETAEWFRQQLIIGGARGNLND